MSHEEIYNEFKSALLKASPELENNICINANAQLIHQDHTVSYFKQYRQITLEDVLMSSNKLKIGIEVADHGRIVYQEKYYCEWTLGIPASLQSNETLIALTNLLTDK